MQHPELPLFAFLSAILVLIPVIWHWRSHNIAILAVAFWLSLSDIINGVNTIVWAGNVEDHIPVWCDMTTKFLVGASYALPLATLCICKHLEMVSSSRKVSYDARDRKRRMLFEAFMCFGLPVIFMALHYIVQGHRYDIVENTGCQAAVYISFPAVFIIWFPQLLFSVITLIYAALALHNFVRRRLTFAAHLQNSNSALTPNRYLRLIAMSLTQMIWVTSLTSFNLWNNVHGGLLPYTSWADVHSDFSRVGLFPAILIPPQLLRAVMLFWWSLPASSFIFFLFFGFGEEAVKEYKKVWTWFRTVILRRPVEDKKSAFGSYPSSRRGPKPLHLVSLKTNSSSGSSNMDSPSRDWKSETPKSLTSDYLSQSSATLTASSGGFYEHKKAKSLEAQEDVEARYHEPAPSYYTPTTPYQQELALPIDTKRISHSPNSAVVEVPRSPSVSDLDACETFTISTFSYYGGQPVTPTAPLPNSPALSTFQPETPIALAPPSLPPPPRRVPRHMDSNGSVNSAMSVMTVPEDVGHTSHEGRRTLGVSGGAIFVTVEREAQTDATD